MAGAKDLTEVKRGWGSVVRVLGEGRELHLKEVEWRETVGFEKWEGRLKGI